VVEAVGNVEDLSERWWRLWGKVGEALGLVGGCPGEGPGRSGEGRVGCGKDLGGSG
jgi:hypothetical protein